MLNLALIVPNKRVYAIKDSTERSDSVQNKNENNIGNIKDKTKANGTKCLIDKESNCLV